MPEQPSFQNILMVGRPGTVGAPETLLALKEYLISLGRQVFIEKNTAHMLSKHKLTIVDTHQIPEECDLIIVIGGDGSLLSAVHSALSKQLPILGINRGRLGFLTDIHPDELHKIGDILDGHYQSEQRTLLNTELHHNGKILHQSMALNETVLLPGDIAHMIEFEIHIDDRFVCRQRADGLIVATPTGSTAYALSGGGPILHPQLDAMVLVSMFPHTLSTRPLVVCGDSHIEIIICSNNNTKPNVSCDGRERIALPAGGRIHIRRKKDSLQLIHPEDYNYFTTLREKLGWERHTTRS